MTLTMKINSPALFKRKTNASQAGTGRARDRGALPSLPQRSRTRSQRLSPPCRGFSTLSEIFRHGLGTWPTAGASPTGCAETLGRGRAGAGCALGPHTREPLDWALRGGRTDDGRGLVARGRWKGRPDAVPTARPSPKAPRCGRQQRSPRRTGPGTEPEPEPEARAALTVSPAPRPGTSGRSGKLGGPAPESGSGDRARGTVLGAARGSGLGYWPGGPAWGTSPGNQLGAQTWARRVPRAVRGAGLDGAMGTCP